MAPATPCGFYAIQKRLTIERTRPSMILLLILEWPKVAGVVIKAFRCRASAPRTAKC